jgi:hypothetical protein
VTAIDAVAAAGNDERRASIERWIAKDSMRLAVTDE